MVKALRFLKRLIGSDGTFEQSTEKAGVTYITRLGVLGDRLQDFKEMFEKAKDDPSKIHMSAEFWTSSLPWLQIRGDQHMFKKVRAFLRNYALFKRIENMKNGTQNDDEENNKDKDREDIRSGIKETYDLITVRMVNQATMLIALSFRAMDVTDARTYVISKPEIMMPYGRTTPTSDGGISRTHEEKPKGGPYKKEMSSKVE